MKAEWGICRTPEEIHAAGRHAARGMADLTESESGKVLALLAPYRDQLISATGREPAA